MNKNEPACSITFFLFWSSVAGHFPLFKRGFDRPHSPCDMACEIRRITGPDSLLRAQKWSNSFGSAQVVVYIPLTCPSKLGLGSLHCSVLCFWLGHVSFSHVCAWGEHRRCSPLIARTRISRGFTYLCVIRPCAGVATLPCVRSQRGTLSHWRGRIPRGRTQHIYAREATCGPRPTTYTHAFRTTFPLVNTGNLKKMLIFGRFHFDWLWPYIHAIWPCFPYKSMGNSEKMLIFLHFCSTAHPPYIHGQNKVFPLIS